MLNFIKVVFLSLFWNEDKIEEEAVSYSSDAFHIYEQAYDANDMPMPFIWAHFWMDKTGDWLFYLLDARTYDRVCYAIHSEEQLAIYGFCPSCGFEPALKEEQSVSLKKRNDYRTGMFGNDDDAVNVLIHAEDRDAWVFQVEVLSTNHPSFKKGQILTVSMDDVNDIA